MKIAKEISNDMAKIIYDAMAEKKADDIKVINIEDVSTIADYFVICSGNNTPHTEAIMDEVINNLSKNGYTSRRVEGTKHNGWVLIDYGDVVVHIFSKDDRLFYDLERIWRDGKLVNREEL